MKQSRIDLLIEKIGRREKEGEKKKRIEKLVSNCNILDIR